MVSESEALILIFLNKKQKKSNYVSRIRKDWNFWDQILQAKATLDKKLQIFNFFFFNFSSSFF